MKIVRLEYDRDAENPANYDGQWTIYSFGRRHCNYKDPDDFFESRKVDGRWVHVPKSIGLRRKLETGTAFLLSYYEHGACQWSLAGTGPQCQWDSVSFAGLLVWEHPVKDMGAKTYAEREKDAEQFLETYTNWCNGYVYGYIIEEEVTLPCGHTETKDVDSCWGFFEPKHMAEEVRVNVEPGEEVKFIGEAAWLADYNDFGQRKKERPKSEAQPTV